MVGLNPNDVQRERDTKIKGLLKILPKRVPTDVFQDYESLVGMNSVKQNAKKLISRHIFESKRKDFALAASKGAQHTVFLGNSGTGKTTVARLRGELLYSLGLAGNRYLELSRENMVGEYQGHTEATLLKMIEEADIIFVDEAYSLVTGSKQDFGMLIVNALMTALENKRDSLVVFFAGYPKEMEEFLSSNRGFKSRIAYYEEFPDYSIDELEFMLVKKLGVQDMYLEAEAKTEAVDQLDQLKKAVGDHDFGNAREVRTIVEQLPDQMALRLFPDITCDYKENFNRATMVEELDRKKLPQTSSGIYLAKPEDLSGLVDDNLRRVTVEDVRGLEIAKRGISRVKTKEAVIKGIR